MNRPRLAAGLAVAACAVLTAFVLPAISGEERWSAEAVRAKFPDPDAGAEAESFADNAECKECHEDRVKSLAASAHKSLVNAKKSGTRGCQECHGPAATHVDESGDTPLRAPSLTPDKLAITPWKPKPPAEGDPPREVPAPDVRAMNGVCLRCHAEVLTTPLHEHREWLAWSPKVPAERSCVSCHAVHADAKEPAFDAGIGPFSRAEDLAKHATFADPAKCAACHVGFHPEMARSGHDFLAKDGPDHGCGACHGPGSLHVASGGDPKKIVKPDPLRPRDADSSCRACHDGERAIARWTCSEHERQGVACIVCHDANAPRGRTLRAPEFELCGQCHLDVKNRFRLPNRHRVAEGRMACSDCHDPHGNTDRLRDKDLNLRVCGDCHEEKAGPFLFDHGIKRSEGCVACHDPHGSTNKRMLTHARIQPLCLQCHPETPHDLRSRRFDNCISCHSEIHGSDLDREFLK